MQILMINRDGLNQIAYGRNTSDTIYRAVFASADLNTNFQFPLTTLDAEDVSRVIVSVSPGLQVLFDYDVITNTVSNAFGLRKGELVVYESLFSIPNSATTINIMPIGVPTGSTGQVVLSFFQ